MGDRETTLSVEFLVKTDLKAGRYADTFIDDCIANPGASANLNPFE